MKIVPKILTEFVIGTVVSFIFGVIGLISLSTLGAYGCAPWIDTLFHLSGYESCGAFGAITGILAGSFLGVFIIHRSKFQSLTLFILAIAAFILLLTFISIFFRFYFSQPGQEFSSLLAILKIILGLAILSGFFILILNWKKIFRQQPKVSSGSTQEERKGNRKF